MSGTKARAAAARLRDVLDEDDTGAAASSDTDRSAASIDAGAVPESLRKRHPSSLRAAGLAALLGASADLSGSEAELEVELTDLAASAAASGSKEALQRDLAAYRQASRARSDRLQQLLLHLTEEAEGAAAGGSGSTAGGSAKSGASSPTSSSTSPRGTMRRLPSMDAALVDGNSSSGIPTRALLRAVKKHRRNKFYFDLIVYCIFLALYFIIVLSIRRTHRAWSMTDAIGDLFLDEEFPASVNQQSGAIEGPQFKKNFEDIMTHTELFEWLEGPLMGGLFSDSWYNDVRKPERQRFFLMGQNQVVGPVQLRQVRVKDGSCALGEEFAEEGWPCYGEYTRLTRSTATHGGSVFHSDLSFMPHKSGFPGDYARDGFLQYLPLNETLARAKLAELKAERWIDGATSALAVTFNLYNRNVRMVMVNRVLLQFSLGGRIELGWWTTVMPVAPYATATQRLRGVVEFIFCIMVVYYTVVEVREMWRLRSARLYFAQLWNCVEMANLVLYATTIIMWSAYATLPVIYDFEDNVLKHGLRGEFVDLFDVGELFNAIVIITAINSCFSFFKVFKFLQLSKRMTLLWDTLVAAASDLFSMIIVFLLILAGFALTAHLLFGYRVREFHSVTSSLSSLFRSLLGEFDYDSMQEAQPVVAPLFFVVFMFIVFLVIVNMFIAVVSEHYETVKEEAVAEARSTRGNVALVPSLAGRLRLQLLDRLKDIDQGFGATLRDRLVRLGTRRSSYSGGGAATPARQRRPSKQAARARDKQLRDEVRQQLGALFTKAESSLRPEDDQDFGRDVYERFLSALEYMGDEERMGCIKLHHLRLVFAREEIVQSIVSLYKQHRNILNSAADDDEDDDDLAKEMAVARRIDDVHDKLDRFSVLPDRMLALETKLDALCTLMLVEKNYVKAAVSESVVDEEEKEE